MFGDALQHDANFLSIQSNVVMVVESSQSGCGS